MSRLLDVHNFVGDKLRWQEMLLVDVRLTILARVIGAILTHDLRADRGAAWRAQANIAIALGVSLSSVRRGLAELSRAGYLAVRKSRGRGRTQQYVPMLLDEQYQLNRSIIDQVVELRKASAIASREKGLSPTKDDAGKVSRLETDGLEKVSVLEIDDLEKVPPAKRKGVIGERQYLEESFTPPSPPSRRERHLGESRANRVRGRWTEEPSAPHPTFQSLEVREVARKRLGEEGVRSWLDDSAWDSLGRIVVCPRSFTADRLSRDIGRDLKAIGVTIVADKKRFSELMKASRPCVSHQPNGATA